MRLAFAIALAACGPTLTVHERAAPRRVDVAKQATAPELVVVARFVGTDAIELAAKRTSDVKLTRIVHYAATSLEFGRGNPLLQLIEIPAGLILLIGGPGAWENPYRIRETRSTKAVQSSNWIGALLNPFQSQWWSRMKVNASSDAEVFTDPPVVRQFQLRVPAPGVAIVYRVLDEVERPIAAGTVTTDSFGRATIPNVPGAIAVEIRRDSKPIVLPVEEAIP